MLRFIKFIAACVIASQAVAGGDGAMQSLDSANSLQAVGRVNVGASGFCTGTLIAPQVVLTAAHCFFDKSTGQRVAVDDVEFLAGLHGGHAAAYRAAHRVVLHPGYVYLGSGRMDNVHSDLALIELDHPIQSHDITPFAATDHSAAGQALQLVSYARDREDAPTLQRRCHVLAQQGGVDVTSCAVDFGASGAPIFVVRDGVPMLTSIVSAKGEWKGQNVAIAASVAQSLTDLIAQFEGRAVGYRSADATGNTVALGNSQDMVGGLLTKP